MLEVMAILDEAGLSTHVLDARHDDEPFSLDYLRLRTHEGGVIEISTTYDDWTLQVSLTTWSSNAYHCQRGIPEWCGTQYGKLENILFGVKGGGP